ncbi:MAG: hypothetical protein P8178_06055 [Candidatus Thiodiazotropha sp.]
MSPVDADAIAPLLQIVRDEPDPELRLAALHAASNFPLDEQAWQALADQTYRITCDEPPGSATRRNALSLAVQIPLLSLRQHMRSLAADADEPDRDAIAETLRMVGDPSSLEPLLDAARQGDDEAYRQLASMPLENAGLQPEDLPAPVTDEMTNTGFWYALMLARLGDFAALDAYLDGLLPDPPLFWGSPWSAYDAIATMRPIPSPMREHLRDKLTHCEGIPTQRLVQLTAWAATGIADAEGSPLAGEPPSPQEPPGFVPDDTAEQETARRIIETVRDGNRDAVNRAADGMENIFLGNAIIESLPDDLPARAWPVGELARLQLEAARTALDDDQMAWVLAHGEPPRLFSAVEELFAETDERDRRLHLFHLLGCVGNHCAGRAGSPFRGAGGSTAAVSPGRGPLIDDAYYEAAMTAAEPPPEPAPEPKEDARRVQARILHDGKPRNTFVTGADNVVRCWIGLPEPTAATADMSIPYVDIPPEGLPLTAMLSWGDQTDSRPLLLPPARDARTGDCDLRIRVPEGERYVCVDITFLYRGRAFEVVQVQAFALAPGEAELPQHDIQVRVQVSRREVIELPGSHAFDASCLWDDDRARPGQDPDTPPRPSLRVFGGTGGGRYDLSDANAAIAWVNETLFITEKSLVRRRAASGADDSGPMLDADDPEVLSLLRDIARHGATLYNGLVAQGFQDPGTRIQLLNREPHGYVPLEFVYDRGYPADDARLCDGWQTALMSDEDVCPVCGHAALTLEQRDRTETICPLGFWSLQKIIERLDPTTPETSIAAPTVQRRALPPIERALFASSHRVPEAARESVWQCLSEHFDTPGKAEAWDQWKRALADNPQLLLMLPHHGVEAALDYLEIGDEAQPAVSRRLSLGQLTRLYVNPQSVMPGPIVLLLGCQTGTRTETGYVTLVRRFQQLQSAIVVGTLSKILGRHAAPVARAFVEQLLAVSDPQADFGTLMRRVRRRMLADGYLMALCLVALGDAEWRLTPRTANPDPTSPGGDPHVSP